MTGRRGAVQRLAPALLVALLAGSPAQAATVTARVETDPGDRGGPFQVMRVAYVAEPGEANRLAASGPAGGVRLRDEGAPLRLEGPCERVDDFEVVCRHPAVRIDRIDTGDGDDRAESRGVDVALGPGDDEAVSVGFGMLLGGEGNDRLSGLVLVGNEGDDALTLTGVGDAGGGPGDDVITGSPAGDELDGGPGRDELHGGEGDDRLMDDNRFGDGPDEVWPDLYDGGPGRDGVDYVGRVGSLRIDLTAPDAAGAEDEGDRLACIERVSGGSGDDVLVGDAGANSLVGREGADAVVGGAGIDVLDGSEGADSVDGGPGADDVRGGSGPDVVAGGDDDDRVDAGPGADRAFGAGGHDLLVGGPGVDLLEGGEGDDRLFASDLLRDSALCGPGSDRLEADRGDAVADCEAVDARRPGSLLFADGRRHGRKTLTVDRFGRVRPFVLCVDERPFDCSGTMAIRVGGRTVASGEWACATDPEAECHGEGGGATLRLPRALVRRVQRRGRVGAQSVIALGPGLGRGGLAVVEPIWLVRR